MIFTDSEHTLKNLQQLFYYNDPDNRLTKTELFPGVDLYHLKFGKTPAHLKHENLDSVVQINYCQSGQLHWKMKSGNSLYLNHGNYSLHTMKACTQSFMEFPQGAYECLTICIDFEKLKTKPLRLFDGEIYNLDFLYDKFCGGNKITSLTASSRSEKIFEGFLNLPQHNALNYTRLKFWELVIWLENIDLTPLTMLKEYTPDNVAVIQKNS